MPCQSLVPRNLPVISPQKGNFSSFGMMVCFSCVSSSHRASETANRPRFRLKAVVELTSSQRNVRLYCPQRRTRINAHCRSRLFLVSRCRWQKTENRQVNSNNLDAADLPSTSPAFKWLPYDFRFFHSALSKIFLYVQLAPNSAFFNASR